MYQYPYGDTQQLNLDWLMEQWQETKASIDGSLQGEIDRVEAAITDLLTARDQAVAAKTAAETAATSASGYAGTASGAASTATAQAAAAAASAALAGSKASDAQTAEANAALQATAAANSAAAAAVSKTNAGNSETAAAASSSAAAGNALFAEGVAKGTQNGTPVASGSPYYEDNAAYWAGEAQGHAGAAVAAAYYSEAMAKGTVDGTPVSSGDPGYEDNAEYYKDQAAAQAAAAAASAASADGTNAQKMIAAPEEASSTASAAHAAGTYFRYNNKLYKATQDIALGGTITPNTNCVEDTVCAELTAQSEQIGVISTQWTSGSVYTNQGVGNTVDYIVHENAAYRHTIVECSKGDKFYLKGVLGGSSPRLYAFVDVNDKIISASGSSMNVVEPFILEAPENAVKAIFNDHHNPLNGTIYKGLPVPYIIYEMNNINITNGNISTFLLGGFSMIPFIQGSSYVNEQGYSQFSYRADRCSTDLNYPVSLCKGDIIHVNNGYKFYIYKSTVTKEGIINTSYSGGWKSSDFTVNDDGLYYFFVENSAGSAISPTEAKNNVWVVHKGYKPDNLFVLQSNPYQNIVWDSVQDVTSTTHVHCTTQEQFETLQAHYDHVAVSNYVPAIPYYPLSGYFTSVGTTLASPNAEHRHFTGYATSLHMNSVGSFLTSNDDYDGNAFNMIKNTNNTLKQNSGGGVTINHPKWSSLTKDTIESFINNGGVLGIEIWNASAEQDNSTGDSTDIWDSVLSDGIQAYGFAVPDHEVQYAPNENRQPFGYNHLLVVNKTEEEIMSAYRMGHFYTTLYNDGLTLEELTIESGTLSIEVSEASTIKFITATRTETATGTPTTATFATQSGDVYVRVEVSRGTNKLYTNAIFI